jgi:hypothetical protein
VSPVFVAECRTELLNLRYSQLAPITMWEEKNTGTNLPAQIEIYATDGDAYKFLFFAKGGGSANKSLLFQETKALLNPQSLMKFIEAKLRGLGKDVEAFGFESIQQYGRGDNQWPGDIAAWRAEFANLLRQDTRVATA